MVVGNKNKRGRKKEKEGRGFGRLPSSFFLPFLFVFLTVCFLMDLLRCVILVQIWLCFLCFEDLISLVLEVFNCAFVWTLRGIRLSGDTGSGLKRRIEQITNKQSSNEDMDTQNQVFEEYNTIDLPYFVQVSKAI